MPVFVDYSGGFRKLNRLQRMISAKAWETNKDLGDLGKFRARELAPWSRSRTSGRHLATMIVNRTKYDDQGGSSEVVSMNPEGSRFNLPLFLAENAENYGHWRKTGHWDYMERTKDYLNRKKKGVATRHFNKIKLR